MCRWDVSSEVITKTCTKCQRTVNISLMERKKTGKFGVGSWCKQCKSLDRSRYRRSRNYRESNLQYYYRNKEKWRAIKARRRAAEINADVPCFRDEVKDFYDKCPRGYEVDHIVPLQGKTVCGLHVPWNLQYLTVSENRSKGNRFDDSKVYEEM